MIPAIQKKSPENHTSREDSRWRKWASECEQEAN